MSEELCRLIYVSRRSASLDSNVMLAMCAEFAARNASHQVTGLLLVVGDHYLQILEGPQDSVAQLMLNIARDSRHQDVMLLSERPVKKRIFGTWAMRGMDVQSSLDIDQGLRLRLQDLVHRGSRDADRDPEVARRLVGDIARQLLQAQQKADRVAGLVVPARLG